MSLNETKPKLLVVDADSLAAEALATAVRLEGFDGQTASSAEEALERVNEAGQTGFAAAMVDVALPGMDGLELLRAFGKSHKALAVIMVASYGTVEAAVESLRRGAVDFLTKPIAPAELRVALQRAMRQHTLTAENVSLKRELDGRSDIENVVGSEPRMLKIFELVKAVAPSKTTVLMCGESGTGKSLIAHAIHKLSPRRDKPFVELACGSIPETLLESELFGHVKGAFTGAHADKQGRFVAANGGTIFLDEINSASPAMQLKLLRVIQERKFEAVGSDKTQEVDVRIVLASNQPLEKLVEQGAFRQDLYYRIAVVKIELPPLRDRPGDVVMLADKFLARFGAELGKSLVGFTPQAIAALTRYHFPGNVRELQNIIERAAVLCAGQTVDEADLPANVIEGAPAKLTLRADADDQPWVPMHLEDALREPERKILLRALTANLWNRQKTADQLGINRTTLYKKLKALGIDPDQQAA